jgi:hypothetical protein
MQRMLPVDQRNLFLSSRRDVGKVKTTCQKAVTGVKGGFHLDIFVTATYTYY